MKQFNGSSTPYATPADFMALIDVNVPGLLARDDDSQASSTQLLTDPNLAVALSAGSGILEGALLVSERYTVADIQSIPSGSNAAWMIKLIVCGLALQILRNRRGIMEQTVYPAYQQATALIEALHQGKDIFAFQETESAGLPAIYQMQSQDFFNFTPNLVTNNIRQWGIRLNRRGFPGGGDLGGNSGSCGW